MPTLHWIGKEKVLNHHLEVPFRLLRHESTHGETDTGNRILHGDNLEALKALLPEYEGRVKCIYIDPPYNTGNEGWAYNDAVNDPKILRWLHKVVGKEGEDLSRHDKWLCMMYPRLRLLHKLLADDGAIFISIDDNEQAHLRLVMDEIWGIGNFITNIVWQKIYTVKNSAKYLSDMHEYLTVYAKKANSWNRNLLPRTSELDETYSNPDNDERGAWTTNAIQARNFYSLGTYEIKGPNGKGYFPPNGTYWRISKETFEELNKDKRIYWGKDGAGIPRIKKFLSEAKQGVVPTTWWTHSEAGQNADAKIELREIFKKEGDEIFTTPKPARLIERILQIATDKNSIILDSFAGSGTTAHAVLNLNQQDGGNRKFILIEMEDYAETLTAERVRRVMNGYAGKPGTGGGFDYYTLGEPLFREDGLLNEAAGEAAIRRYVWHAETRQPWPVETNQHRWLMGVNEGTAWWFCYEREQAVVLDVDLFSTVVSAKTGETSVVYADYCTLPDDLMQTRGIRFKKIPRDIPRL